MPKMDGTELGKILSTDQRYEDMKLVMMTSVSFQGGASKMAEQGFSAYFPKPVTTQDLFSTLQILADDGQALKSATPLVTANSISTLIDNDNSHYEWPENTRLLLVEDNQINQLVATSTLKNFNLTTDIANNGLEAISALINSGGSVPYSLILMDCQMPEMDGYDASRAIRAGKGGNHYRDIPIIAMTANAMQGDKEKCLEAGMSDYLSKPINNDALIKTLVDYLNGKKVSSQKAPAENINVKATQETEDHSSQNSMKEDWNKEALMERIYGNKDLYTTLLETYLAEKSKYVSDFESALSDKDFKKAKAAAHLVKGVAGQLCATNLHEIAESLEQACVQEDLAQINILYLNYLRLMDGLEVQFKSELEEERSHQASDASSASVDEIKPLLIQLDEKLSRFDYIEPELLQPLKTAFSDNETLHTLCNKLVEAINLFDNEAASATLKELLEQVN